MIRIFFFILMACGLAGFGSVAWIATRPAKSQSVAELPVRQVILVAAHPITAGALLKPDDFVARSVAIPNHKDDDMALDTPEVRRSLVGAMARRTLTTAEPIRTSDLIRPGEHGFLAAALHPGMRAVTITVDAATGEGDLISPGDRVDLILTQSLAEPNVPAGRRVAAETILSDVRVLAIDQKIVVGAAATRSDSRRGRTVTLEVTEEQAQRVSVALQLGHLSLSVRSAASLPPASASGAANGTVWALDVSPALGAAGSAPPPNGTVRVFQGAAEVKEFKF